MTIGYILLGLGILNIIWTIYSIRNYRPDRIGIIETALHDIVRTTPRPKTRLVIMVERSSHWVGLVMGLVIMTLGVIFIYSE